ncbi:MAG: hypothetical protein A2Z34_04280 [Planctomycetes bacterium RBG_16_59_8]|nr:MAG: hypothetical protein A2Z34_04280 [Planctomycetes bacterium RBG_16_59_8]
MIHPAASDPVLLPTPKKAQFKEGRIPMDSPVIVIPVDEKAIRYGAKLFNETMKTLSGREAIIASGLRKPGQPTIVVAVDPSLKNIPPEGSRIRMTRDDVGGWNILLEARDDRGVLYALLTLRQLLVKENDRLFLVEAEIDDHPSFAIRDFNRDGFNAMPDAPALAEWAAVAKANVVGISHFWPWRKVPDDYWKDVREVGAFARESGAVDMMFYCNPYTDHHKERQINLLDQADLNLFLAHIRTALDLGATKVMVCVDDYTVWDRFTPEERKTFKDLPHAQAFLMNHLYREIRKDYPSVEWYFCPAGPKGGYAGVPTKGSEQARTLEVLAAEIPEDVAIVWTGPVVRSRKITAAEIDAWSRAAGGRKPFLWDNTIYAHYQPLFVETFLNPFRNDFPADMAQRMNRGIHINGAAGTERIKLSLLTAGDYLWNPERYDPGKSLATAMRIAAGEAAVPLLERFREEALAAIRASKKKGADAEALAAKAVKTLDDLDGVTSNRNLTEELRTFLSKQTKR